MKLQVLFYRFYGLTQMHSCGNNNTFLASNDAGLVVDNSIDDFNLVDVAACHLFWSWLHIMCHALALPSLCYYVALKASGNHVYLSKLELCRPDPGKFNFN